MSLPLFREYPHLAQQLSHLPLGNFPTPVEQLAQVGAELSLERLYIKRDDLSGTVYGGNKVRKLEFLLAAARRDGAKEVVSFGFAGSNHVLATAIYARQLGLNCTAMLLPQVNAHYVRRNLLAGLHFNSDLRHYGGRLQITLGFIGKLLQGKLHYGRFPTIIPAGGTCPLGVLGYVNALLELKEQIMVGELPEPDRIYVPLGSMGTSAGLMLGLKIAGLKSRVVAVRVIEEKMITTQKMLRLLRETVVFLRERDASFPDVKFSEEDLIIRNDCLGDGYALFTDKAVQAAELMHRQEGIMLNGAYSAKAFAAVVDDAASGRLKGKTVLFWNTYNSRDISTIAAGADYRQLPKGFHQYFEEEVQPLDTAGLDR